MSFPRIQPIAEHALMVEFSATEDDRAHEQVIDLDAALRAAPFPGCLEVVPALVSLLVEFDPEETDHARAGVAISRLMAVGGQARKSPEVHQMGICYDEEFSPDLPEVAARTGLSPAQVIAAHVAGDYSVAMYGFAPGYAYLSGLPAALRLPRKPFAIRDVPAGSVIIAAGQCLVTTLTMPTGWWIIGRSRNPILQMEAAHPFRFDIGDRILFHQISRDELGAAGAGSQP